VPGARAALLLLGQRQKLEADEERRNTGQVAIVVRVRLGVTTADEGVRGDQLAAAELRIALRQHRTLVEPAGPTGFDPFQTLPRGGLIPLHGAFSGNAAELKP